jgi:hypothetical protein
MYTLLTVTAGLPTPWPWIAPSPIAVLPPIP